MRDLAAVACCNTRHQKSHKYARKQGLQKHPHPDVVAFWDTLAAQARGLHDVRLNETGRTGERLTLRHEELWTGRTPKWVPLNSNEDGYYILSSLNAENRTPACIEVKASQLGLNGSFYLTRHEWEAAESFLHYHVHLWDLSDAIPRLAVAYRRLRPLGRLRCWEK